MEKQGFLSTDKSLGIRTKYTLKVVSESHRCHRVTRDTESQTGDSQSKTGDTGVPRTSKEPVKEPRIAIPEFIDADTWRDFLSIRRKLKAVNSERALNALIKKLTTFHDDGHDVNHLLETSIVSSWKDVYPPRTGDRSSTGSTSDTSPKPWQLSNNEVYKACLKHGISTPGKTRQELVSALMTHFETCKCEDSHQRKERSEFDLGKTNLKHLLQEAE